MGKTEARVGKALDVGGSCIRWCQSQDLSLVPLSQAWTLRQARGQSWAGLVPPAFLFLAPGVVRDCSRIRVLWRCLGGPDVMGSGPGLG